MPFKYFRFCTAACLLFFFANFYLPAQVITSCSPNSAPQGATVSVSITGSGVNFNSGTATVDLRPVNTGQNIFSSNFNVINDSTMTALINIPGNATLGSYDMAVGPMPYTPSMFTVTSAASAGTISGRVFHDVNENCSQGAGEPDLSGFIIEANDGTNTYYATTDLTGSYTTVVPPGNYFVDVSPPTHYSRLCPVAPFNINVTAGSVSNNNDIAMDVDSVSDAAISCSAIWFRPGFNTTIYVTVNNIGIVPLTGVASISLDPNLTYISSTPTGTVSGNTVSWNVTTPIPPMGTEIFAVEVNLPATVPLGTIISDTSMFVNDSMEYDPENNTFVCSDVVIGSYDPNDKTVWDQDNNLADPGIDPDDSLLIYRIRFQNTGTASAINVFIRDTLDPLLDPGTLRMLGVSHQPYTMTLSGDGFVEWRFPNIMLPDSFSNEPASHGFVLFDIKPRPGFTFGQTITNKASIYFDFNAPIVTNEVSTIIVSRTDPTPQLPLKVFPNPTSEKLFVELECHSLGGIACQLFNPQGALVREMQAECQGGQQRLTIPVEDLSPGVYLLETTAGGAKASFKVAITR